MLEHKIALSISVVSQNELKTRSYTNLLDAVRGIEGVGNGESHQKYDNSASQLGTANSIERLLRAAYSE